MTIGGLRPFGVVSLAITGITALAGPCGIAPKPASGAGVLRAQVRLLDTQAWVMGGSGDPIPSQELIDHLAAQFGDPGTPLFPGQPTFSFDGVNAVPTPEGLYPVTGVQSLPFNTSAAQGLSIINSTIEDQIAAGNKVLVGGGSQSAVIESMEMQKLLDLPADQQPSAEQLGFLLLVDVAAPNGGLLERFDVPGAPLTVPSFGITFSGATPANTPWDTAIYDMEYDGFSDYPRYPIDLLADVNAILGIAFVHGSIEDLPDSTVAQAVELPVSAGYTGATDYFMIPVQTLPLLDPLASVPVIGKPLVDLLQPDLAVLINLGYGDIGGVNDDGFLTGGWDPGPANVATPFSLFPTGINWGDVLSALVGGAKQGVTDSIHDLGSLSASDLSEASGGLSGGTDLLSGLTTLAGLANLTDDVNTLSNLVSASSAALLPAADSLNALLTTLPAYDVSLFTDYLGSGDLLDAVGMPIAADFGLGSLAAFFGLIGIRGIVDALPG